MTAALAARPALVRPRRMLLGGVCEALARHLERPVPLVRGLMILAALAGGAGVLLYLWLWALVPLEDGDGRVHRRVPGALLLAALSGAAATTAVVLGLARATGSGGLIPGAVESAVLAVGAVVWSLALDRGEPGHARTQSVVGGVAGGVLVVEGVLLLPGQTRPATAVLAVVLMVIGIAILAAPRVVGAWTDLIAERSERVRESQRAEIAAHLHDSVLQTLAVIQHRAGPHSEVARLARAQERELRDWLFAGTDPFAGDVATELRSVAGELELEHPVRFEIVTAGDVGAIGSAALVGAAREAMLNAARHAGGEVTVYIEATPAEVEVFVRDHGEGFDPEALPDGRIGVRESIVGRMERAGGSARVRSTASGTEVQLRLPGAGA